MFREKPRRSKFPILCTPADQWATQLAVAVPAAPLAVKMGMTDDLRQRLREHNAGESSYIAKFRPWKLTSYVAFADPAKAEAFERYLKSGSGHAFARKRLW
jgi:putative endonuclease